MGIPGNYVLGNSVWEQERLMLQGRVLRPYTERYFRMAGLASGMRVLDIGSGMGDVALLCADIVGPGGRVLGLDRDATTLERARERAGHHGCSSWLSLDLTELDAFSTEERFDALVGRYVLLYQPDPAATLSRLARFVKPGGIVAFHEVDFSLLHPSDPPVPVLDQLVQLIPEAFRRSGLPPDFGRRMGPAFVAAGLPFPTMVAEMPISGGTDMYLRSWMAATLISLSRQFEKLGMRMPDGFAADETLIASLLAVARAHRSQYHGSVQYGAWTRKPYVEVAR
jgi:SAM-dependent methyltransferase